MNIRTDRSINRILLKINDSNELICYRLFCILKNIDTNNSGFVPYTQANKAGTLLLNKNFTLKVINRLPNIQTYMTITDKGVFLNSWTYLWDHFDIAPSTWAEIPYYAFQNAKTFKMHMYAGYIKNTIQSRAAIEEHTGVSKSTQIRYEKSLGIPKQLRAVQHTETTVTDGLALGTINPNAVFANNGQYYQQLPNQYFGNNVDFSSSSIQRKYNGSRQSGHKLHRRNTKKVFQPTAFMLNNKLTHTTQNGSAIVPNGIIMGKIHVCIPVNYGFELS